MEQIVRRKRSGLGTFGSETMSDPTLSNASPPLRRVRHGAMIAGVCGGLARWLGWDPTIVRLLYIIATVASVGFPGILTYLILVFIMPRD